jgi:hypothetical protein
MTITLLSKCNNNSLCGEVLALFFPMSVTVTALHGWNVLRVRFCFQGIVGKQTVFNFPLESDPRQVKKAGHQGYMGQWTTQGNNWWGKSKAFSSRSPILIHTRPAVIKGVKYFRCSFSGFCCIESLCQKTSPQRSI